MVGAWQPTPAAVGRTRRRPPLSLAWLAAAAAPLLQPRGAAGQGIPLRPPALEPECACQGDDVGFNENEGTCSQGVATTCEACPKQVRCATIRSEAGDGVRAWQGAPGDCRLADPAQCPDAGRVSLSYPTSIDIDSQDNIYIADSGSNRIRLLSAATGTLVTIAGTGASGFGGDGGAALNAILWRPDGIAVKPGLNLQARAVGVEIYVSDFFNQRIRQLVQNASGWFIYTVAGTGVRGDNLTCDLGCKGLQAQLNYPRAVAFSSKQELYFIDSGNFKVRKLTTFVDPDRSQGMLTTFIGATSHRYAATSTRRMEMLGSSFLPGHWEEANANVAIKTWFFLNIDQDDMLWYIDGDTNRILMTPLRSDAPAVTSSSPVANAYAEHYLMHFAQGAPNMSALRRQALAALLRWLPVETGQTPSLEIIETPAKYRFGTSYWRYAQPQRGEWCKTLSIGSRELCEPSTAQTTRFQSIAGFCFDAARNLYIGDAESSQLLYLSRASAADERRLTDTSGAAITTRGCPCTKYWHTSDADICGAGADCRHLCRENPQAYALLQSLYRANLTNISKVSDLPPCAATNYCATTPPSTLEWCYINRTATASLSAAQAKGCPARDSWGFCGKTGLGISFEAFPNAAIFGHEMRRTRVVTGKTLDDITALRSQLTPDLWTAGNSILVGYVYANVTKTPCVTQPLDFTLDSSFGVKGQQCALRSLPDLVNIQASGILSANNSTVALIFKDPVTMPIGGPEGNTIDDCQNQCMLDSQCKSFMVGYNNTLRRVMMPSTCYFFSQNYPYYVYVLDKARVDTASLPTATADQLAAYRSTLYKAAISPMSRLLNGTAGLAVTDNGVNNVDVVAGPYPAASLQLNECQDLCIYHPLCFAIAWPGCYLLSAAAAVRAAAGVPDPASVGPTVVYVKRFTEDQVTGVAGFPQVHAYGEAVLAGDGYLNRPSTCVIDSKGSLHVADVWNQRIREVSGVRVDCHYAHVSATGDPMQVQVEVQSYLAAVRTASQACLQDSTTAALYTQMQQQVVLQRSTQLVQDRFCQYNPTAADSKSASFYQNYTQNALILCLACKAVAQPTQPAVCPPAALCGCRTALDQVIQSQVYRRCRAPNSYGDPWHRFATGVLTCWLGSQDEATWYTNSTKWDSLLNALRAY